MLILAISIAGSLLMYPLVNKFAKKRGKKLPIILGCTVFSAAEIVICFIDMLPGNRLVLACVFALFVSFPFAVLNVLPGAMMAVHEKGRCTARLIAKNLPGHAGLEGGDTRPPSCVWRPLSQRRTRRNRTSGGSTRRYVGCSRPWRPT